MTPLAPAAPPSLRAIVAALGGDLYDQGRRANVPAPGHSARDRSVSLLLADGRLVIHSFGAATWREVLADLRARGLVGPTLPGGAAPRLAPPQGDRARIEAALALWDGAAAAGPGSLAARYARFRGVSRPLAAIADLRSHPAAPLSAYRPGPAVRPALLAAVRAPDGGLTAVEVTYLAPPGRRAADLRLSRKTIGRLPPGSAARLDPPGRRLVVAEGVFSALSAGEHFNAPAWALMATTNLRRWSPPAGTEEVIVAGDRDPAALATRLRGQGVTAAVRLPQPPFGDCNEAAASGGGRKGARFPEACPPHGPIAIVRSSAPLGDGRTDVGVTDLRDRSDGRVPAAPPADGQPAPALAGAGSSWGRKGSGGTGTGETGDGGMAPVGFVPKEIVRPRLASTETPSRLDELGRLAELDDALRPSGPSVAKSHRPSIWRRGIKSMPRS
jgi:putative DNA primase/helicase